MSNERLTGGLFFAYGKDATPTFAANLPSADWDSVTKVNENTVQKYTTENNEKHTVYWAKEMNVKASISNKLEPPTPEPIRQHQSHQSQHRRHHQHL